MQKNVGISLARYHLAMQGFDHPAADRKHRWNLVETAQHKDITDRVDDSEKQALLAWGFDAWCRVENTLKPLPRQFIHGDVNPENILVDGDQMTGLAELRRLEADWAEGPYLAIRLL